ncbi:MAG: C39 family peptidase [Coriobacteriales bacterium]|jgi:uncharacterized protein YvpB|nr:C39 family peptidase [Coriobacteriales bacterium]
MSKKQEAAVAAVAAVTAVAAATADVASEEHAAQDADIEGVESKEAAPATTEKTALAAALAEQRLIAVLQRCIAVIVTVDLFVGMYFLANTDAQTGEGNTTSPTVSAGSGDGLNSLSASIFAHASQPGLAERASALEHLPAVTAALADPTPAPAEALLDVPFIAQLPQWPSGCESVAAVMALDYAGVDISVADFVGNYLPRGNAPYYSGDRLLSVNPIKAFPGDPASADGWYIFALPMSEALSKLHSGVYYSTGGTLDDLCRQRVAHGEPVLVWITSNLSRPYLQLTVYDEDEPDTELQFIGNAHCVVLVGYDAEYFYVNDPLSGKAVAYPRETAELAFQWMGAQAIILDTTTGRPK